MKFDHCIIHPQNWSVCQFHIIFPLISCRPSKLMWCSMQLGQESWLLDIKKNRLKGFWHLVGMPPWPLPLDFFHTCSNWGASRTPRNNISSVIGLLQDLPGTIWKKGWPGIPCLASYHNVRQTTCILLAPLFIQSLANHTFSDIPISLSDKKTSSRISQNVELALYKTL